MAIVTVISQSFLIYYVFQFEFAAKGLVIRIGILSETNRINPSADLVSFSVFRLIMNFGELSAIFIASK